MIKVELSIAVGIYLIFSMILLLSLWVWQSFKKEKHISLASDEKKVVQCSVCFYSYVDNKKDSISKCPQCGSWNKKEQNP